ncbi:MAG TPA: hypothetical protein VFB12_02540 [Ktedonobacteraceae bacterium]|nr:hypothetical protein [Ktedonobacteraceae bacterium]
MERLATTGAEVLTTNAGLSTQRRGATVPFWGFIAQYNTLNLLQINNIIKMWETHRDQIYRVRRFIAKNNTHHLTKHVNYH